MCSITGKSEKLLYVDLKKGCLIWFPPPDKPLRNSIPSSRNFFSIKSFGSKNSDSLRSKSFLKFAI